MKHILQFTMPTKEGLGHHTRIPEGPWYFLRAGSQWPNDPAKRLIDATTKNMDEARRFDTDEDARAQLAICGSPAGWNIVEVES